MKYYLKLAALSVGLSLGVAGSSSAALVVINPNPDIPIPTNFQGVSVNLVTGAFANTDNLSGAHANFFFGGAGISNDADLTISSPVWQPVRTGTGSLDPVDNLALGSTVGPGSTFGSGFGGSGNPNAHLGNTFTDGEAGYIGFSMEVGGNTHYGWMHVILEDNEAGGAILRWGYDDTPDTPVIVPEPTVPLLGLLALAGLAFRRRRS